MVSVRLWITAVLGAAALCTSARAQTASEYQVKSAYLYDLAKMAGWPEQALPSNADSKLVICVLGGDADFPDVLRSTLAGKNIGDHSIEVRHVQSPAELKSCHLAFFRASVHDVPAAIAGLEKASVLCVGENKEFLKQGGMINLVMEDRKIRFELNSPAIEQAHIRYGELGSTALAKAGAESKAEGKAARAVRISTQPQYPAIARQMNLRGSVQLEVIIKADGSVKDVHVIGEHPLLAEAAARSVRQWRFEPAGQETTELLRVSFEPNGGTN
jgi:TonB family protein